MARKPKAIQVPGEQFEPDNVTPTPAAPITKPADDTPIGTVRFGMRMTAAGWVSNSESE